MLPCIVSFMCMPFVFPDYTEGAGDNMVSMSLVQCSWNTMYLVTTSNTLPFGAYRKCGKTIQTAPSGTHHLQVKIAVVFSIPSPPSSFVTIATSFGDPMSTSALSLKGNILWCSSPSSGLGWSCNQKGLGQSNSLRAAKQTESMVEATHPRTDSERTPVSLDPLSCPCLDPFRGLGVHLPYILSHKSLSSLK